MVEPSYAKVEELLFGRMAFHGMNPEIERMMEDQRVREEETAALKREKDISDKEMAVALSTGGSLRGTVAKKFASKRDWDGSQRKAAGKSKQSTESGEQLLQAGTVLLSQMRSHNRTWQRQNQDQTAIEGKKRRFIKPQE